MPSPATPSPPRKPPAPPPPPTASTAPSASSDVKLPPRLPPFASALDALCSAAAAASSGVVSGSLDAQPGLRALDVFLTTLRAPGLTPDGGVAATAVPPHAPSIAHAPPLVLADGDTSVRLLNRPPGDTPLAAAPVAAALVTAAQHIAGDDRSIEPAGDAAGGATAGTGAAPDPVIRPGSAGNAPFKKENMEPAAAGSCGGGAT
eukprot:1325561-Prymnesium_polylepis.1